MLAAARSTECRLKCCWLFARRIIESIGRVWLGLRFFPIKINKSKNTSCSCRSTRLASGSLLQLASIVSPRLPACLPAWELAFSPQLSSGAPPLTRRQRRFASSAEGTPTRRWPPARDDLPARMRLLHSDLITLFGDSAASAGAAQYRLDR